MSSDSPASTSADDLEEVLQGCCLLFNDSQRRRLRWLRERKGRPRIWRRKPDFPTNCRFVLVVEPLTGMQIEQFLATIACDAVVVIPCGEDPAYDRLKSQLLAFGTVGVEGAKGPHQMWWGGASLAALPPMTAPVRRMDSVLVTTVDGCSSVRNDGEAALASPPIVPDAHPEDRATAERILSSWQAGERPLVWADRRVCPATAPAVIDSVECDFAVFKRQRWQFNADMLYFGRRPVTESLLRTWVAFCRRFPGVDDGILLDQAWCLVTSQIGLDTFWLPVDRKSNPELFRRPDSLSDRDDGREQDSRAAELPAGQFFAGRIRAARSAERTGFPEVLLSAPAAPGTERRAIAIIRDVTFRQSRALAALVEALAGAFATDPGGFRQLEIALCARREELYAALQSAPVDRALVVTPEHKVAPDTFRRLAEASDTIVFVPPSAVVVDLAGYRSHLSADALESVGRA